MQHPKSASGDTEGTMIIAFSAHAASRRMVQPARTQDCSLTQCMTVCMTVCCCINGVHDSLHDSLHESLPPASLTYTTAMHHRCKGVM